MAGREFFLWQVRSFTIRVDLNLIDLLNRCLSDPRLKPGAETGGILLGRVLSPCEIEVSDFEFVPSEHRRGIIYSLGFREQASLADRVARLSRTSSAKPVGFFRTHERKGLFLDQNDFSLIQEVFTGSEQIALLIRPMEPGPSNAGFFFREEGELDRRQSHLVFPFDSATLRIQGPVVTEIPKPVAIKPTRTSRMTVVPVRKMGWAAAAVAGTLVLGAQLSRMQIHSTPPAKAAPAKQEVAFSRPVVPPPEAEQMAAAPLPESVADPIGLPQTYEPPESATPQAEPVAPAPVKPKPAASIKPIPYVAPSPFTAPSQPKTEARVLAPAPAPLPKPEPVAAPPSPAPQPAPDLPRPPASRMAVRVAVSFEAPRSSELKRVVSHVPLFGHLAHAEGGKDFIPARPEHPLALRVPPGLANDFEGGLAVDVRLTIDKSGQIRNREVVHGSGSDFASLAENHAGSVAWEPAHEGDRSVTSDVIVHYRFQVE